MKKKLIFIIAISFVGILAMSGCGCDTSEQTGSLNGHGYVDLGLPSGTLWATCNIGADDPNDAGDYFSYGKTTSWSEEDMRNYSYSPSIIPQEYIREFDVFHVCFLELHPDILDLYLHFSTLNKSDDAATYNWGGAWRMPTKEDCEELMSECGWEWISHNFQKGYKVTGPNGNSIFLPTTGYQSMMAGIPLLGILWPGTSEEGNGYYRMSSCFWGEIDSEKGWSSPVLFLGETPDSPIEINFTPAANAGVPIRPVYSPSSASQTSSSKTSSVEETKTKGSCNGHDCVDLGLPSGTKWATCNVGATTPEGYGDYFAWGETTTKETYNMDTYRYYDGSNYTKYTGSDNLTTLEASDDAATVNWGAGWRMPTREEFEELITNCTVTWTTQNSVKGRLFTSNINGKSIFLPAAGERDGSRLHHDEGSYGYYRSGSLSPSSRSDCAWLIYFYSDYCDMADFRRDFGWSVRPVCNTKGDFNDVRTNKQDEKRERQEEFANWLETDLLWRRYNIEGYDLVLYSYWFKSGQYMLSRAVISSDYYEDFEDYEQHGPYKYSIKGNTVYNGDDNVFFEIDMSRNYIVIGGKKYYRGADAAMSAFKKDL